MNPWNETPSGKPRARGIGIPFQGTPGVNNAITDVEGVAVGYSTLIEGDSVRTGVTAILPRPVEALGTPVFAGCHSLNGNGELTGTLWMEEAGRMDCPDDHHQYAFLRRCPGLDHQVDGRACRTGELGAASRWRNL